MNFQAHPAESRLAVWSTLRFSAMALLLVLTVRGASAQTPQEMSKQILERALAAREAGDFKGVQTILEDGIKTVGPRHPASFNLYGMLGEHHSDVGNMSKAIESIELRLLTARTPVREFNTQARLSVMNSAVRRFDKAKDAMERVESLQRQLRATPAWFDQGDAWQATVAWVKGKYFSGKGQLAEAELAWKTCLSAISKKLQKDAEDGNAVFRFADCATGLISNQIHTGQLAAAAGLADQNRKAIEQAAESQQRPLLHVRLAFVFGDLAVEQGRPDEAKAIYAQALKSIEDLNAGDSSGRAATLRHNLATLEMLQGRWAQALELFDARAAALKRRGAGEFRGVPSSEEHAYALVRVGKAAQALEMMRARVAGQRTLYDENSLHLWEGRAYLGLTLAAAGQREEALREMRLAVPKVLDMLKAERGSEESGVRRTAKLNWLLDAYIHLLADSAAAGDAAALDEAFRMTDLARGSSVQRALAASASRANIADPALAALARTEQDLQREISAISDGLGNLLSRGRVWKIHRSMALCARQLCGA